MADVENAFETTSELLLGKALKPLKKYEKWLLKRVEGVVDSKSVVSGRKVYTPPLEFFERVRSRIVTFDEALELGKKELEKSELSDLSLASAEKKLKKIAYTTPEAELGRNLSISETALCADSSSTFRSSIAVYSKYAAYCFWPTACEYVFGCSILISSRFCIHCYNSAYLTRCFEVDSSTNCRDSYFCHNCEGLDNCMFCFNVKSKRYAIGNVEVGKERYEEIKRKILSEIMGELEKKGNLKQDIFSLD
ncbi:MAG: hypothetical protein ABIH99_00330 [Candidatus Micrarchaeota archaeon]